MGTLAGLSETHALVPRRNFAHFKPSLALGTASHVASKFEMLSRISSAARFAAMPLRSVPEEAAVG